MISIYVYDKVYIYIILYMIDISPQNASGVVSKYFGIGQESLLREFHSSLLKMAIEIVSFPMKIAW